MNLKQLESYLPSNVDVPSYVSIKSPNDPRPTVLTKPATELTFPLSREDLSDLALLQLKFDHSGGGGLAAVQIGISKSAVIFAAPDDPILKKWRPDHTQIMPKTLWINPSYDVDPLSEEREDFEACFSVDNYAGIVKRPSRIFYKAFDLNGDMVEGTAEGFLARLIQHEVDHVHGILYLDRISDPSKLMTIEEYKSIRANKEKDDD